MPEKRIKIKGYHVFYITFFVVYFFLLYFLLYHPNGLFPFQVNIHFFSNVLGSISKRFLAETAPYALLFFLIYYAKRKWLRIFLIAVFLALLLINLGIIYYYFVTRINVHLYVLRGFQWNLLFSYFDFKVAIIALLTIAIISSLTILLYRIRSTSKIPLVKRIAYIAVFAGLIIGGNYIPVVYSPHITMFSPDSIEKKYFKNIELENSGVAVLANELKYEYFSPKPRRQEFTEEEKEFIASLELDEKLIHDSFFKPKKIVLIATESLNQSFLSYYNKEIPEVTPFIDSLIEKYPHIDSFYPSGTYTLYGLGALLCGHTNTVMLTKNSDYKCLPNLLKEAGYMTEFIRGFSKYYLGENVFFDKIGYDTITALEEFDKKYPDFKNQRPDLYDSWGFSDDYLFDEVVERLKENTDEKMFLTVLTVDTHVAGGRCFYEKTDADLENDVLFSVTCFDKALAGFFEKLESNDLFNEDLLVILTADHLYTSYTGIPGDDFQISFLTEPATIPFIFITKAPVELLADMGSQLDVPSTVLDLLDIETPDYYMGKSLINNSNTVPMGQDRVYAYMIVNNAFYAFNFLQKNEGSLDEMFPGSNGFYLRRTTMHTEEIFKKIEKKREEDSQKWNDNSAFYKWYLDQWIF